MKLAKSKKGMDQYTLAAAIIIGIITLLIFLFYYGGLDLYGLYENSP